MAVIVSAFTPCTKSKWFVVERVTMGCTGATNLSVQGALEVSVVCSEAALSGV